MAEKLKSKTFILFSVPTFCQGMGRVLDIGATMDEYNSSEDEEAADRKALKSDWETIGEDLKASIANYRIQFIEK